MTGLSCCCVAEKLLWKSASVVGFFLLRYAHLWRWEGSLLPSRISTTFLSKRSATNLLCCCFPAGPTCSGCVRWCQKGSWQWCWTPAALWGWALCQAQWPICSQGPAAGKWWCSSAIACQTPQQLLGCEGVVVKVAEGECSCSWECIGQLVTPFCQPCSGVNVASQISPQNTILGRCTAQTKL